MTTPRLEQQIISADHDDVYYPIDDDEPLAESEYQLFPLNYAYGALRSWFEDDPTTWVGSDMFLYYEEGVPNNSVAPDVFVVTRTHKRHLRDTFKMWKEGRVPEFVLEIMSRTSVHRDTVKKYDLYERLGVREYWLYDPTERGVLDPRLRGYELVGGEYRPLEVREVDGKCSGASDVLGLELHAEFGWFRFFDPVSGEYLPSDAERKRAQAEAERGRADAELGRMEAEWGRMEAEQALSSEQQARAEAERALSSEHRARAEAERAWAESERARQRLESLLREYGIEPPSQAG